MPLVVPQAALVRLIWTNSGVPYAINVIGTRKTGATVIDQALANTVGATIKAAITSAGHIGSVGPTVALAQVGVRDISSANNAEFLDAGAPVTGGAAANLLPPQTALCITLRTARAGKSFRGRIYLGGFTVTANAATGTVNSATATAAVAFIEALRTGLPPNGLSLAVVSRKLLSTELVTTTQSRDLIWDTIRGRATAGV